MGDTYQAIFTTLYSYSHSLFLFMQHEWSLFTQHVLIYTTCSYSHYLFFLFLLQKWCLFTQYVLIYAIFSSCSCCRNGGYLHNMFLFTLSFLLVHSAGTVLIYTISRYMMNLGHSSLVCSLVFISIISFISFIYYYVFIYYLLLQNTS